MTDDLFFMLLLNDKRHFHIVNCHSKVTALSCFGCDVCRFVHNFLRKST